ncbi:MAG: mannonate dehydratase [Actinomycetota bacterium]|nr:mannonate dehydratase [Actinomycetota bacterium]
MKLSELLNSRPEPLWNLVKQCGVDHAVMILAGAEQEARWLRSADQAVPVPAAGGDAPWSEPRLHQLQQEVGEYGMRIAAIEDTPPMDRIRLGLAGRDQDIDAVLVQIAAMGRLGIPVLCYNWMAVTSWARTDVTVPLRGGALSSGYSERAAAALPSLVEPGEITADQLWSALEYFLAATVPAAEEAGVRLSLHPDDPPLPAMRGVPRIINSIEAYRRVLALRQSPSNAITLCQGNFALMTDELPSVIREFGQQDAVAFVHFRDVLGTADDFIETFHDEGQNDLEACMRAYAEVGFDGPMRPDHVPTLFGESNDRPGYATLGRLYAIGYLRALQQVAYGRRS